MEFVGKIVKKDFKGFGIFEGVVESYDSLTGFFKILYEDGDSEEADVSEVARLASFSAGDSEKEKVPAKRVGRKPKRRRWSGRDPGKEGSENLAPEVHLEQKSLKNLEEIEPRLGQNVVDDIFVSGNGNLGDGLDLNRACDLDNGAENGKIREFIDLNLSVENNDFVGDEEKGRKELGFDLNLGIDDENLNGVDGAKDAYVCVGLEGDLQNGGVIACQWTPNSVIDTNHVNSSRTLDLNLEESCLDVVAPSPCEDGNSGHRKRRKVATKPVLRRSARRAKAAALKESNTSCAMVADDASDLYLSGLTDESEEKPNSLDTERLEETGALPPITELPPSSANLNLEGICVLDIFSVYSCLRSFSTLLYLSPFELEDFVAALRSKASSLLIDCIHVSILQTLRKHLEFLANEGCESVSTCLRNMNWDLLDVITWPTFMVEYLLIHGSGLKPGFNLGHLNLFDGEYYKQPIEMKLELLRCLCDDVIEVDAVRSELSKRMTVANAVMDFGLTSNNGLYKKSRISSDAPGDSCMLEGVEEEVADGNSDECCLCKMDGNLICCDGCPAAYHSKCVGIVSTLLPEGDWYCPECVIGKPNFGTKPQKLVRGAELLGNDPYGRLYFSCFDYLLVSDFYDAEASFHYYHKDDLSAVTQIPKSSYIFYGPILKAISQHWGISTDLHEPKSDLESRNCTLKDGKIDGIKRKSSVVPGCSSYLLGAEAVKCNLKTENPLTIPEGSVEVMQANQLFPHSPGSGFTTACHAPSTRSTLSAKKRKKNRSLVERRRSVLKTKEDVFQGQDREGYINRYSFGLTASSIVEELLQKPSDKANVDQPKTEEEIISIQSKFILKKSSKFCWLAIQDLDEERRKEKCGWCYCCRFPVEGRDCLCNLSSRPPLAEGLKAEFDAFLSKKNKKAHLIAVICHILAMEERLRGFLLGPWLSPHYTELWRKSILKASDVSSLKIPLLMLESNLRPLALLADWWKHVDSVATMGSATHFVAKSRVTSKNGVSRRKGRYADSETKPLNAGGGLGLFWWRGGRVSRSLFNWKVVPRSLALKAARKAGRIKLPGIQYPDGSENARRSKCVAWRASVEASTSIEQLALQVRELDLFVRWDDIENTHPLSVLDKDSLKSIRLFKKVIIRRKSVEGTHVKYLLDFGKRRSIPDVVIKHGTKLEESSDERKKYWLEECHVPLHLLKSFEERRITRKAGKTKSSKVRKGGRAMKRPLKRKGFDYLFSRAERADSYQCGHCNKNVPISEAVSCRHCNGFFHKRHVMKSSDATTSGCIYTCHRCRAGKYVKTESVGRKRKIGKLLGVKKLKVDSGRSSAILRPKPGKNGKALANSCELRLGNGRRMQYREQQLPPRSASVYAGMTLRRSARKAHQSPPQCISAGGKKRKRCKSASIASKECPKVCSWQKSRSKIHYSFWLNGLLLSRKPNDERVVQFKRRKLLFPSEFSTGVDDPPNCSICSEQGFRPASTYIGCETCGEWFHGDAFGINEGNVKSVIGFKCHLCLEKSPPVCPGDISGNSMVFFTEPTTKQGTENTQGPLGVLVSHKETDRLHELHSDEISPDFMEVQILQNRELDHDMTPTTDSELRVENESPACKEAEVRAIESQNGCLKTSMVTVSGKNSVLEESKIISNESRLMPPYEIESQSPASKEAQAIDIESQNGDLKNYVPTASGESSTLEEDKDISNESELMLLDRLESQSPVNVEAEAKDVESQNGNLESNVPTASDENSALEVNKNISNESQFMLLDEVESWSPACEEAEVRDIESQNEHLKVNAPTTSGENCTQEENNSILNKSQLMLLDETEARYPVSKEIETGDIGCQNGGIKAIVPTANGGDNMLEVNKNIVNGSQLMQLDATES